VKPQAECEMRTLIPSLAEGDEGGSFTQEAWKHYQDQDNEEIFQKGLGLKALKRLQEYPV